MAWAATGLRYSVANVGAYGGEPSIVSDSKGVLYDTTPSGLPSGQYQGSPPVYRSANHGSSWTLIQPADDNRLEANLSEPGCKRRRLPCGSERRRGQRTCSAPRSGQHQVEWRRVPQRTVVEDVAERANDRVDVGAGIWTCHRQPVRGDAPVG